MIFNKGFRVLLLGKGRNLSEGIPRSFSLNSNEILESLQEPLHGIVSAVKTALEQTPPELGADVAERGIVVTRSPFCTPRAFYTLAKRHTCS